ncbi:hypothetical protein [Salinibius halmophilus]|uniref:hypothetical protein n=1 Tax=Salinibius halmophilus TaxID=1853216 RepID=UPI000E66F85D|nr:hypothetical protein [Salinibius halmophilus]
MMIAIYWQLPLKLAIKVKHTARPAKQTVKPSDLRSLPPHLQRDVGVQDGTAVRSRELTD